MVKILLIAAIVISVVTAGIGFLNQQKLSGAADELNSVRSSLKNTQGELATANESLEQAQQEITELSKTKGDASAELTAAKTQAEDAKAQVSKLEDQVKQAEEQATTLRNELQAKQTRVAELEAAQTGAVAQPTEQVNVEEFELRIQEQNTLIESLKSQLDSARSDVASLREREQQRAQQVMRQGLSGRILAVNQGWNFVVLNLGDRNGVINNAEMLVTRGDQMIGKIRITSVEPSSSIADIVVNSVPRGFNIQPGDRVIYTGSTN